MIPLKHRRNAARFRSVFLQVALGSACFLSAVSAANAAGRYLAKVWAAEEGLPGSSVTSLAQTPDGYLWVGTYNGLARFDGVRFVSFFPASTPALTHPRIQALAVDSVGTLWITTYDNALVSYRAGDFKLERPGRGEMNIPLTLASSSSNSWLFASQVGEVLRREIREPGADAVWTDLTPTGGQRIVFQCVDRKGDRWFTSREGRALRLKGGVFEEVPSQLMPRAGGVLTLATDAEGAVWAGTSVGVWRWDGERFHDASATNGEPQYTVESLLPARDGGLWVWGDGRLRKQADRKWVREVTEWKGLLGFAGGHDMLMNEDASGGLWLSHYGNGLFHISADGELQRFTSANGLPGDRVWTWFQMRAGTIWAGIDRGGLVNIRERQFEVVGPAEGLPAQAALSICEDASGAMWFGTSGGGLCRMADGRLESFAISEDASENFVFSMYPQPGQGLWLSASSGEDLFIFKNGEIQRGPWLVHGIKSMLVDRAGRLWMGTKSGLNWWTPTARRGFGARDGLALSPVRALAEDESGQIWCGTDDGTLYRCELDKVEAFRPTGSLVAAPISALSPDTDGVIWIGTFSGGLLRFKQGTFTRISAANGLPNDMITQVLDDNGGWLWMGTQNGISRVQKAELNAFADGEIDRVNCITYGLYDGLPTVECAANYQPACWRGNDGRIWFATMKGVVSVNPGELDRNPVPPAVLLEETHVDGEAVSTSGGKLVVPPGRRRFEFHYTAFSFTAPDRILFRYRLSGVDAHWVEAGTQRVATYSVLPPGAYKFEVLACSSDGVWSETGASLALVVKPHFYETGWFATAMSLLVLGGVALAVRRHTARRYRLAMQHLEQQHAIERDRARIAKDIHDDLGAGLTQITLLSELARQDSPEQTEAHLGRISDSARRMTLAMDEIVWAVDPQHDTLAGFMDYASVFAEDFLGTAGIRCRIDVPPELPAMPMDAEVRYNLFLAVKEALNNIVKHSQATEVWLRLRVETRRITLMVQDNGRGMPQAQASAGDGRIASGHGMANLEKRLQTIGGSCVVSSDSGHGTRVELSVAMAGASSPLVATSQSGPVKAH